MDEIWYADAFGVGITEAHVRVVATDGAHFGGFWLGRTDDLADQWYAFDAFENHSDDGAGHHVVKIVAESLLAATGNHLADVFVVGAVLVFIWRDHLHTDDFETDAFKASDDFADDATLDGIGLQNDEATFYEIFFFSHKITPL